MRRQRCGFFVVREGPLNNVTEFGELQTTLYMELSRAHARNEHLTTTCGHLSHVFRMAHIFTVPHCRHYPPPPPEGILIFRVIPFYWIAVSRTGYLLFVSSGLFMLFFCCCCVCVKVTSMGVCAFVHQCIGNGLLHHPCHTRPNRANRVECRRSGVGGDGVQ